MTKHTPGPWGIFDLHNKDSLGAPQYRITRDDTTNLTRQIATIYCDLPVIDADKPLVACLAECAANAKLIASAPDLLAERDRLRALNAELVAALKMARQCIVYCRRNHKDAQTEAGDGIPVEVFIDAALAKAGEK